MKSCDIKMIHTLKILIILYWIFLANCQIAIIFENLAFYELETVIALLFNTQINILILTINYISYVQKENDFKNTNFNQFSYIINGEGLCLKFLI